MIVPRYLSAQGHTHIHKPENTMIFFFEAYCCILLIVFSQAASSLSLPLDISKQNHLASNSTGVLDVFQVYQPIPFADDGASRCNITLLLMEHEFAYSYGQPFVGK